LSESLEERLKYAPFNQTEYKVLVKLVERAMNRGKGIQEEQKILGAITKRAYEILNRGEFIQILPQSKINLGGFKNRCTIGVDGSFCPAGGTAGLWYAPITAVRVILRCGVESLSAFNADSDLEAEGDIVLVDERHAEKSIWEEQYASSAYSYPSSVN